MESVKTVVVYQRRLDELVNGEHPYTGRIELQDQNARLIEVRKVESVYYRKLIAGISEVLREHPHASVVFCCAGAPKPVQISDELRNLVRDDPVAAIRSLSAGSAAPSYTILSAGHDTLSQTFGDRVYLSMRAGKVEDPITGDYRQLAYGNERGWMIRGESNKHREWVKIRLEGIPEEASEQSTFQLLGQCKWATVLIEDLLSMNVDKFYLPRQWNSEPWITREELEKRFVTFDSGRKEVNQ